MDTINSIGGFAILLLAVSIYFIPALVAIWRDHRNWIGICILNLFGGWSILGWVIALVWSLTVELVPGGVTHWPMEPSKPAAHRPNRHAHISPSYPNVAKPTFGKKRR